MALLPWCCDRTDHQHFTLAFRRKTRGWLDIVVPLVWWLWQKVSWMFEIQPSGQVAHPPSVCPLRISLSPPQSYFTRKICLSDITSYHQEFHNKSSHQHFLHKLNTAPPYPTLTTTYTHPSTHNITLFHIPLPEGFYHHNPTIPTSRLSKPTIAANDA